MAATVVTAGTAARARSAPPALWQVARAEPEELAALAVRAVPVAAGARWPVTAVMAVAVETGVPGVPAVPAEMVRTGSPGPISMAGPAVRAEMVGPAELAVPVDRAVRPKPRVTPMERRALVVLAGTVGPPESAVTAPTR